ncbi:MAG TPA: DUF4337 domain-containing protein [Bryobacteraceae bacterium]|jgi:hypothetical protein|nr:DUF4337 domain-containing protein [Bryobacteraceae bacterium]
MPEIEIKTEGGESDPLGQKVGVLAAVLAVFLAVVSIASHRAHTTAVVERSEANDKWSQYQSNRIKFHSLELGVDLMNVMGRDKPDAEQTITRYESQKTKYEKESQEVKDEATKKEQETRHTEDQALRYDLGEGMLEIGVVLASLYFISRKKLFPVISVIFGVLGIVIAISGALL